MGFGLRSFIHCILYSAFLFHFNELLSGSSVLDPTLVADRTVLIVKNLLKGNVPSNYLFIYYLEISFQCLKIYVAQALVYHWSNPLPAEGTSKGSKNHLIIDKFVMEDARKRHRNLFTAWLDVKKAYDAVPHDWILHCLKLVCTKNSCFLGIRNVPLVYFVNCEWYIFG